MMRSSGFGGLVPAGGAPALVHLSVSFVSDYFSCATISFFPPFVFSAMQVVVDLPEN